jgi:NAD(P)H-dependent FMN reductase
MTSRRAASPQPVRSAHPDGVGALTIVGISASLKPAAEGRGRSAACSLLSYALGSMADARLDVALLDLRTAPLPLFDGHTPAQRRDENLHFALRCIERAGGIMLAVPAYWAGVSGVFKNFVDVLCGPAYDLPDPTSTVFNGKPVALLVVGADEASARAGAREAPRIMASTGAQLVGSPVCVANPRTGLSDPRELSRQLLLLGGQLGFAVHSGSRNVDREEALAWQLADGGAVRRE